MPAISMFSIEANSGRPMRLREGKVRCREATTTFALTEANSLENSLWEPEEGEVDIQSVACSTVSSSSFSAHCWIEGNTE